MKNILIRKATIKDYSVIFKIYSHPLVNPFMHYPNPSLQKFRVLWKRMLSESEIFIFEKGKKIIGYCGFQQSEGICRHVATIHTLAIDPSLHTKGFGEFTINYFIKLAKKRKIKRLQLIVESDNKKAINFYKKLKFEKEGILKKYVKRPNKYIDDYIMARLL